MTLAAIRERDANAQCVDPYCHQTAADRRALLAELARIQTAVRELMEGQIRVSNLTRLDPDKPIMVPAFSIAEDLAKILTDGEPET